MSSTTTTSCRPGVMPSSSTRTYIVRRLDSTEQEVTLFKKATGGDCLDRVCRSLGILEKDYFGLRYVDKNGEYLWINLRNPLHEQIVPGNRPIMEMRVKYFIRPHKILQPITRLHFYKQIRRDLIQGKLKVNTALKASRLSALMAQIEGGDFSSSTKYKYKITCQADNDNMDARVKREHQKLAGTLFDVAIEKFLEEASLLELYGVELYHVLDNRHLPKIIGVGPESVHIHSVSMEPIKRFSYSSIKYTAFHAKKFTALVASNKDSAHTEQIDFELKSRASAQALYRTITEFHTFFRRETVTRVVKMAGYCKSLLGNFKGQNPDRFYFDVMKTHREVVDKVWSILHPSTVLDQSERSSSTTPSQSSASSPQRRGNSRRSSSDIPPPLPPPMRNTHRGSSSVHRSSSVHDSENGRYPPQRLPPYTPQRSTSVEFVPNMTRRSTANLPTHGPHMASTASFNPYLSPSISENGTDTEDESLYASGGSDCYVSMSTRSDPSYIFSTQSDPGTHRILPDLAGDRQRRGQSTGQNTRRLDTSGAEMYLTSGDSDISTNSGRINSPPPLYSEVDPEHSAPLEFSFSGGNDASMNFVSPIIPISGEAETGEVVDFDANAVLTRTRELEGELQRLRTAMTCRLCKQNPIGATFCPCGHTVCCFSCAQRLRTCWECDQTVNSVQRMLLTRV